MQVSSAQGWEPLLSPFAWPKGSLIIKERLGTSDEETVEQIRENPYLQYFLGLSEYTDQAPFEASMMVHFRKRLSLEMVGRINEQVVAQLTDQSAAEAEPKEAGEAGANDKDNEDEPPPVAKNQGQLMLDATCAPADIRYPTDLGLLNEAREQTEKMIDELYKQLQDDLKQKPRTYRQQARRA